MKDKELQLTMLAQQLQADYNSMMKERDSWKSSYRQMQKERDMWMKKCQELEKECNWLNDEMGFFTRG